MNKDNVTAMRMRLRIGSSRAAVGQDVPVEQPYGLVMPGDIANKALEVNTYVRTLNDDIQAHAARLGEQFLHDWHVFVTDWQDTYDMMVNHWYSWANRLTGTAMTRVQEMEAKARTFAVKYRNLTGSAPPGVVEPSQRPNPGNIVSGIATPIAIAAAALGGLFLVVQMSK